MIEYVCVIEVESKRIKLALVDRNGELKAFSSAGVICAHQQSEYQNADEYFYIICDLIDNAMNQIRIGGEQISALTITSQRTSILPVEKSGRVKENCLIWHDGKGGEELKLLIEKIGTNRFVEITGLPMSGLWSVARLLHLKEHDSSFFSQTEQIILLQDYILHRLGSRYYVTDRSHASTTGVMNIKEERWSEELLNLCGIHQDMLPAIQKAGSLVGRMNAAGSQATGFLPGTPLILGGGNRQCVALATGSLQEGEVALSLGTNSLLSCPIKSHIQGSDDGFFCTPHLIDGHYILTELKKPYGDSIQFLHEFYDIHNMDHEKIEVKPYSIEPPLFIPYFYRLHNNKPDIKTLTQMLSNHAGSESTREKNIFHFFTGIALETRRILNLLSRFTPIHSLTVAGHSAQHPSVMQILADLNEVEVCYHPTKEPGILGASILAWVGAGRFYSGEEGSIEFGKTRKVKIEPTLPKDKRDKLYEEYLIEIQKMDK